MINELPMFLLTLGYGRSGSSMIGSILNQHPNCIMTNEFRFLQKYYSSNGENVSELLQGLFKTACNEYSFSHKLLKNQNDHVEMKNKLSKKSIVYYGDKKSCGNTTVFLNDPLFCQKFVEENSNVKYIITMRNPFNVMKSVKKSKYFNRFSAFIKCNENTSEQQIFQDILMYQNYSLNFFKRHPDQTYILYYDDVLNDTNNSIKTLFAFLKIKHYYELNHFVNQNKKESMDMPHIYEQMIYSTIDEENIYYYNRYISGVGR